jgi:hypothetical protein
MLRPFQTPSDGLHVESARPVGVAQLNTSLFLRRPAAALNSRKLKIILFEQTSLAPDLGGLSPAKNVRRISQWSSATRAAAWRAQ